MISWFYDAAAQVECGTVPRGCNTTRRPLKSGEGIIAAELPLMVTASDGVMASRFWALKVHDAVHL
jgi:hypothetical protein